MSEYLTRKRLEKLAQEKGYAVRVRVWQAAPYWNAQVSIYHSDDDSLEGWVTSFNAQGFLLRRRDAMGCVFGLVEEAKAWLTQQGKLTESDYSGLMGA